MGFCFKKKMVVREWGRDKEEKEIERGIKWEEKGEKKEGNLEREERKGKVE